MENSFGASIHSPAVEEDKNRRATNALVSATGNRQQAAKVRTRKPGADYWRRVYRIAGSMSFFARLKIALRIARGV